MIAALLVVLLALALFSTLSRDLLHGIVALSAFSLVCAAIFYLLHAPDVAITEAAVGAGVSTIIFLWALRATGRKDDS